MRILSSLVLTALFATPVAAQCRMHVLTENGAPTGFFDVDAHLGWVLGAHSTSAQLWNSNLEFERAFARPTGGTGYFGEAVALDDRYVAVGDPRNSYVSGVETGVVWVWDRATGVLLHELVASDAEAWDRFGQSLDIADGRLYVGAPNYSYASGTDVDAVYVFDLATGLELQKWSAAGFGGAPTMFGYALDVVGGFALVGAPAYDAGGAGTGAVYVLDVATGQILHQVQGPATSRLFGSAVHVRGTTAVVGTNWLGGTGLHQAFVVDAASGTIVQELLPPAPVAGFGEAVAIVAGRIAVGAPHDNTNGTNAGAVYFFDSATGAYLERALGDDSFDFLGEHIAGDGHRVIAGRQAWVFATGGPDCNSNGEWDGCDIAQGTSVDLNGNWVPDGCESIGAAYCDSAPNSSGQTARLTLFGSNAVADNDVELYLTQAPQNQFGYFLMSSVPDDVPAFGGSQGTLCLGAPIVRLVLASDAVYFTGAAGSATRVLDLGALPQGIVIQPGETWHFQAWFRDVVGTLLTSNTSDGRALLFE